MRDDQTLRGIGIVALAAVYIAHAAFVGADSVSLWGASISSFGATVAGVVVITLPEVLEYVPVGPSRSSQK